MEGLEMKPVALMNYMRSGTLLLFPNWDISRVFSIHHSPEGSAKLRWAGGGAQRPVLRVFGPKMTGAHSARAAKTTNVKIFFLLYHRFGRKKLTVNKKAPPFFLAATCVSDPKFFLCVDRVWIRKVLRK
jgi:hypothetical protein